MLINNVKIGDRLEIKLKKETSLGKTYVSQVENILDNRSLLVHVPISYGQVVKLPVTDIYSLLFFTEKGMMGFDAVISEYVREEGFNLIKFMINTEGERMQRREFFRFNCMLPLKIAKVSDDPNKQDNAEMADGIIKDLGGGGIRFITNLELSERDSIKSHIILQNDLIISIGKVLHKQFFPKSTYKYQYRVEFVGILPSEQEKIVHFIFTEQRKMLSRGRTEF